MKTLRSQSVCLATRHHSLWLSDEMVKGEEVIMEVVSVEREGNGSSVSIAVATVAPSYDQENYKLPG